MDIMGPLPVSLTSRKYALVMIDHLTRYVEVFALRVVVVVVVGLKGTKQLRLYSAQTLSKRAQQELLENKGTKPKRNKSKRTKTKISK